MRTDASGGTVGCTTPRDQGAPHAPQRPVPIRRPRRHLTAAALAPAAIAHAGLAGAPTLRVLDTQWVGLQTAVDEKLPTKAGAADVRVAVAGKAVRRKTTSGRHGDDVLYAGTLSRKGLEVGRKSTVRITVAGEQTVVRTVKLHARKG